MEILSPIYALDRETIAVRAGPEELSYGRLCADIDALACWLLGKGLEPGERIEIHIGNQRLPTYWEWIMHLAAIRAGLAHSTGQLGIPVASTSALGPQKALLGNLASTPAGRGFEGQRLHFAPATFAPLAEQLEAADGSCELEGLERRAVRLLGTSGTTGAPKVVAWDAARIAQRLEQVREVASLGPSIRLLPLLGFPATAGFRYPLAVWQTGGCVLLRTPDMVERRDREFAEQSNLVIGSPFFIGKVLVGIAGEWAGREGRTLRLFGGRLPVKVRDEARERIAARVEMSYGSTETGSVAAGDAALVDRDPGAVGFVLPAVELETVTPEGRPVPSGQEGLVRIRSRQMVDSYILPDRSAGQPGPFRGGWFYPGDLGLLHEDGMLAITGRVSEKINFGGAKFAPVPIEAAIRELPGVEDACLVSVPLDHGDMLAIAVQCGDQVDLNALRTSIAGSGLLQWKFTLLRVPRIPRNEMGKIMRRPVAQRVTARIKRHMAHRTGRAT